MYFGLLLWPILSPISTVYSYRQFFIALSDASKVIIGFVDHRGSLR